MVQKKGLVILGVLVATTATAQPFDIQWYSIDGGSAMNSSGGAFQLSGTIGQADAGTIRGGGFTIVGGFWAVGTNTVLGDCDSDGDVDLRDFACFSKCVTGTGGNIASDCMVFDSDKDGDIDLADFSALYKSFTS